MSFLLLGNVNFISSFTVLALGFALVYSAFNTRLCLSKEVSYSSLVAQKGQEVEQNLVQSYR